MELIIVLMVFILCFSALTAATLGLVIRFSGFVELLGQFPLISNQLPKLTPAYIQLKQIFFKGNILASVEPEGLYLQFGFPYNWLCNQAVFLPWTALNFVDSIAGNEITHPIKQSKVFNSLITYLAKVPKNNQHLQNEDLTIAITDSTVSIKLFANSKFNSLHFFNLENLTESETAQFSYTH